VDIGVTYPARLTCARRRVPGAHRVSANDVHVLKQRIQFSRCSTTQGQWVL